jgi:DNA-directed RNA polymerase specialized sigma24 family protein
VTPSRSAEPNPRPYSGGYLDASFEAFVESNMHGWVRLAHLHVGNRSEAELIAFEVALQLDETWQEVLEHVQNPSLHALALLRSEIEYRFPDRTGEQLVENAAFLRAMLAAEEEFSVLAESIGVYSAVSRLPERQFQVVVLRFVLGYDAKRAAALMGVSRSTIGSLTHYAEHALARDLGIPLTAAGKEERA